MAWVNAFTQGTCSVEVYKNLSLIAPGDYVAEGITLTTTDGVVTLTAPTILSGSVGYEVRVIPAYDTSGMGVRLFSQTFPDQLPTTKAGRWSGGAQAVSPTTPYEFTDGSTDWTYAGSYGQRAEAES